MTALITFLLLTVLLLAPFGVVAAIATTSYRDGTMRLHLGQFTPRAPMVGRLYGMKRSDAKARALGLLERFDLEDAADRPAKT